MGADEGLTSLMVGANSGASALVYEVIWLRKLVLIFGSTLFATSTVLSTFMGGLALGAFVAGKIEDRRRFQPLWLYGILEIGIGLYALAVPALLNSLTPIYKAVWEAGASESFLVLSLAKFVGIAAVQNTVTAEIGDDASVMASGDVSVSASLTADMIRCRIANATAMA